MTTTMKANNDWETIEHAKTSSYTQTEPKTNTTVTQTDFSIETKKIYEYCVSRVDPNTTTQRETHPIGGTSHNDRKTFPIRGQS